MKYFISLISALLFTFTVFAQEQKAIPANFKKPSGRRSADDSGLYGSKHRYSTGHHYPRHSHDQFTESRLAQKSASPR